MACTWRDGTSVHERQKGRVSSRRGNARRGEFTNRRFRFPTAREESTPFIVAAKSRDTSPFSPSSSLCRFHPAVTQVSNGDLGEPRYWAITVRRNGHGGGNSSRIAVGEALTRLNEKVWKRTRPSKTISRGVETLRRESSKLVHVRGRCYVERRRRGR